MAVYFVTGKLGSGKSLVSVSKIRDYLSDGRRVATNLDLHLDSMFTYCKSPAVRLPDKPRVEDMLLLGDGYDSDDPRDNDESRYGLIVLDECGTWLNSREWNDKGRRALIDWFLHARKRRWDIIFLIQDIESADSQIVRALCEHLVVCRRMDRMRFLKLPLPKMHIANVYYGRNKENYVERWVYKGKDLYHAYDTRQVFRDGVDFLESGPTDMRASYTMLSAWHLKGRYLPAPPPPMSIRKRLAVYWGQFICLPILAICRACVSESEFQRTFFHRQWLQAQRQAVQERRGATIDPSGSTHNDSDVMLPLASSQELESVAGTIVEDPGNGFTHSVHYAHDDSLPQFEVVPGAVVPGESVPGNPSPGESPGEVFSGFASFTWSAG